MKTPFDNALFEKTPQVHPAPGFEAPGVRALFYEGPSWQGKATRIFAWYGAPKGDPGERFPAMVLVHGGGGTAFPDWVRLWNARGYAAIAMDTCGGVPGWHETPWSRKPWPRHAHSGPEGWGLDPESFNPDAPLMEQWPFHAVSSVILGHSLLRSFPEVEGEHIGLTGVSWGGYLTCLAAGLDPRFAFAAPVYGCGFLGDPSSGLGMHARHPKLRPQFEKWLSLWDPQHFLPTARMPILWVNGTNDFAFPMNSMQASYRAAPGRRQLAVRVRMPHGHGGAGEKPPEIHAFAEELFRGKKSLPIFQSHGTENDLAWADFAGGSSVVRAELNFTRALGHWTDRTWNTLPALWDGTRARAELPPGTTVWYMNVFTEGDLVASSEHVLA